MGYEENKEMTANEKSVGLTDLMDQLSLCDEDATAQKNKKKTKKKPAAQGTEGPSVRTRSKFAELKASKPVARKPKVGVVYDDFMLLHRSHRAEHPERPERLMAVYLNLVKNGLFKDMVQIDSDEASEEDLLLCHSQKHI